MQRWPSAADSTLRVRVRVELEAALTRIARAIQTDVSQAKHLLVLELDSLTLLLLLQKCDLDVDSWLSKLEYGVTIEASSSAPFFTGLEA